MSKLIWLGTVKLRTLGKVAVVAKRVARALSLPSAEPAFINFLVPLVYIYIYIYIYIYSLK